MVAGYGERPWRRLRWLIPLACILWLAALDGFWLLLGGDGSASAEIASSSGDQEIDQAFADILKEWRFRPAYRKLGNFPIDSTIERRLTPSVT